MTIEWINKWMIDWMVLIGCRLSIHNISQIPMFESREGLWTTLILTAKHTPWAHNFCGHFLFSCFSSAYSNASLRIRAARWRKCVYGFQQFFFVVRHAIVHKWDNRSRERLNGFSWNFYQTIAGKMEFPTPYHRIILWGLKTTQCTLLHVGTGADAWRITHKLVYAGSVLYGRCVKKAWTSECI